MKRGFTLVELITTFALSTVIIILLINVVLVIRNIYTKTNTRTDLYINQSNLSNIMNKKINKDNLVSYDPCDDGEECYQFSFNDGSSSKLIITENTIKFDEFVYKLDNKTQVGNVSIETHSVVGVDQNMNDSMLVIRIPITSLLYPNEDFGINLIYPYNSIQLSL